VFKLRAKKQTQLWEFALFIADQIRQSKLDLDQSWLLQFDMNKSLSLLLISAVFGQATVEKWMENFRQAQTLICQQADLSRKVF